MIPIRIYTVAILEILAATGLVNRHRAPILALAEETKTLTPGSQVFIEQFVIDRNAVLSALSMAILPVLIFYVVFPRQLIRGITSGTEWETQEALIQTT